MADERFDIDYDASRALVSLNDKQEQVVFVLTTEQVEKLLEWYCDTFRKIVL